MALTAHLDETGEVPGRPRQPRRTLRLETAGELASGERTTVLIHNVSASGLLMQTAAALREGEEIDLDLPHAGESRARVVWSNGTLYGCQFDTPLSTAALSAAQLRGAIGEQLDIAAATTGSDNESFAARLHRMRDEAGLTMAALAEKLGVSKPTIWAWEQGKARPVGHRIAAIAEVFGVAPGELLAGRDDEGIRDLIQRSREQIAQAVGTVPERIRISIEL